MKFTGKGMALCWLLAMALLCSACQSAPGGAEITLPGNDPSREPNHMQTQDDPVKDEPVWQPSGQIRVPDAPQSGTETLFGDGYVIFRGTQAEVEGTGCTFENGILKITQPGDYVLTGTLDDGQVQVEVDKEEKVRLFLDGVSLHCSTSAAINGISSDKITVDLAKGSVNLISDGKEYQLPSGEDEPNAALFSKDDMEIKGKGTLYVTGNYYRGIASKDDLEISGGMVYVTAVDDGLRGKDSVTVKAGTVVVEAGADGIRTDNTEDEGKGFITFSGGEITVTAQLDAVQAVTDLTVSGGTVRLQSGGGSANASTGSSQNGGWGNWGGGGRGPNRNPKDQVQQMLKEGNSAKGLKAAGWLTVSGGTVCIDSSDDAMHANGNLTISGGEIRISSGDDGIHADDTVTISNGTVDIVKSYEGIEAAHLQLQGGEVTLLASDDGINGAGGNDGSALGGRPGQGSFSSSSGSLTISGGTYVINAAGDGIDVNGSIRQTGGTMTVFGPTDNGNGALDYDGSFIVDGGELISFGSTGMAQGISSSSKQASLFVGLSASAESVLRIVRDDGTVVLEETAPKRFGCVLISTPGILSGQNYVFYLNGAEIGSVTAK